MKLKLFFISLLIISCCNCSKKEITLEIDDFNQTQWSGTFIDKLRGNKEYKIDIVFSSKEEGYCYYWEKSENEKNKQYKAFEYEVKKNILHIYGEPDNSFLSGQWWISEKNKKTLFLKRDPYDNGYTSTLEIKKTY